MREGKFLLYFAGATKPKEYPRSAIQGINIETCSAPTLPASPVMTTAPSPDGSASLAEPGRFGVHGSNTIGERLMPMLIDAYARKLNAKPSVKIVATEEEEIAFDVNGAKTVVDLKSHGSGTAAKALAEGKASIGMASRRLKPEEVTLLSDKFHVDALAKENEHVLALDGLAVIVNPQNPVQQLSLAQIAGIFSGRIVSWRDVGGADRPIKPLRRDDKSGTYDTFKSLVLTPAKLEIAPRIRDFESSEALSEEVSRDADAIGFVAMPYVNRNRSLAIDSSCGLLERLSIFSVKSESYPLSRRLFLYTVGEQASPAAKDLVHFALSDEAQTTINEAEFVDQSVMFEDELEQLRWASAFIVDPKRGLPPYKAVPNKAVAKFAKLTSATRRLSAMLRFREASSELDNRAIEDTARLARFLNSPALHDKPVHVVGFANANDDWRSNERLALRRAERVAEALTRAGRPTPANAAESFSYLAPTACNDDPAGDAKNRRVEIWVGK